MLPFVNENPYRAAGTFDGVSYIERDADRELYKEIIKNNRYLYFLAPRQSGKSSLISHIRWKLDETIFKNVFIDLSTFPENTLQSRDSFNEHFVNMVYSAFNFEEELENKRDLKKALEKIVKKEDKRILIFIDEIDRILHASFKNSWFGSIRFLFNCRSNKSDIEFNKLQFILSGAASVTSLISDKNMSPFNVGKSIELYDFSYQQTSEIAKHLEKGDWKVREGVAGKIYDFTSGTLYLTQLILEKLWENALERTAAHITEEDVEKTANDLIINSHKDIHFDTIYESIANEPTINKIFIKAIEGRYENNFDMERLKITGILNEKNSFRNQIYEKVFGENGPLSLFSADIKRQVKIEVEIADAFENYKKYVLREHSHLSLNYSGNILNPLLEIAQVYSNVYMMAETGDFKKDPHKKAQSHLIKDIKTAFEAAKTRGFKDIVILGDPGTGKTLLLKYIMIMLLEGKGKEELGLNPGVIPFYAPLSELSDPDEEGFIDFIKRVCRFEKFSIPTQMFKTVLDNESGIILLDGLDEIIEPTTQIKACQWIDKAILEFASTPFIITSRNVGYSGDSRLQSNTLLLSIQDFSFEDIEGILQHWFEAVENVLHPEEEDEWKKKAKKDAFEIAKNIRNAEYMKPLAANPMMLQILGFTLRSRGNRLPQNKIELYHECSEFLIEKWINENESDLELNASETRKIFQSLALWMYKNNRFTALKYEIENQLKECLQHLEKNSTEPTSLFFNIRNRIGFFKMHNEKEYGFTLLIFQEFFAAEKIKNDRNVDILVENYGNERWRQVIHMTLAFDNPSLLDEFIERTTKTEYFKSDKANIDLLVEVIDDAPVKPIKPLVSALKDKSLSPESRQNVMRIFKRISEDKIDEKKIVIDTLKGMVGETGDALADSAYEVLKVLDAAENMVAPYNSRIIKHKKDRSEMVLIPAGSFLYGEQEDSKNGDNNETLQRIIHLPAFYIDLYPVTNRQFCQFLNESRPEVTDLNRWIYLDGKSETEKCRILQSQTHNNYEVERDYEEYPVIYVTWHGAAAYARWAGKRLPSEQEWEKAARGSDGLIYPWGNTFEKGYCNSSESGLLHTSKVTEFPQGKSPYGCWDMAGNVFEWTNSIARDRGNKYALRGGSWFSDSYNCRCAFRNESQPNFMNAYIGFRCAGNIE